MATRTKPLPASESLFEQSEELPMSTALVEHQVTPITLLDKGVEAGFSGEQLRELVSLQQNMAEFDAKQAFARAMHTCQMEMPTVVRDAQNTHTRSKYAFLETIQKQAKPIYSKHGFSLMFGEADCPLTGYKRTTCDCVHEQGHIRSYHLDLPIDGTGAKGGANAMNAVQGCISTTSYGQRRLLCMIFNITIADEDDDGAGATKKITQDQYALLDELIVETNADRKRFLDIYEIEKLGDLPLTRFDAAWTALRRKKELQGK